VSLYQHVPHPHLKRRAEQGPVKVADQMPRGSRYARFNTWLALKVTAGVGSMTCAYAFAIFDAIALPQAIKGGLFGVVQWVASFFLQLVLLSIVMVQQNVQGAASDVRNEQGFQDVEAILHGQGEQAAHLAAQDDQILAILEQITANTALTEEVKAALSPVTHETTTHRTTTVLALDGAEIVRQMQKRRGNEGDGSPVGV
jgi:hypothetical protein